MAMRPLLLLPEMLMFGAGLATLLAGSYLPRRRQGVAGVVAAAGLSAAAVATVALWAAGAREAFDGTFAVDGATGAVRLVVVAATLLVLALARDEMGLAARESETYALLMFAATGACVVGGAHDLLVLAVGFLLASIPLYGLIGLGTGAEAAEATMKTYLMGAFFGILLLLGVTLLHGISGATGYADLGPALAMAPRPAMVAGVVAVVAGLMFKAGGVPAHFWVPDAAQGAPACVAAFLTTVPKIGALVALFRLVAALPEDPAWPWLVAALAVAGMTVGNLAAYWQSDPRRLLGWSTVSQVGYLVVPVAVVGRSDLALPALLLYLAGYAVTNVAAFAVAAALPDRRDLAAYRGLAASRPWLGGALVVALLGLVGTPPTAVFVGKLTVATAAWDGGAGGLALVLLGNTVLSLFYYLRWLAPAVSREGGAERSLRGAFAPLALSTRVATGAAVAAVGLGLLSGLMWAVLDAPLLPGRS